MTSALTIYLELVLAAGSWYVQKQNMYLAIAPMPPATSPATIVQRRAGGDSCQNVVLRGNICVISDKQGSQSSQANPLLSTNIGHFVIHLRGIYYVFVNPLKRQMY